MANLKRKSMTPEIIEGNKLIAEFMGGKVEQFTWRKYEPMGVSFEKETHGLHGHLLCDLEYHTSWDWVWPVCEKIGEQTGAITLEAIFRTLTNYYGKIICNRHQLWEAVICYIKTINQQTHPQ